MRTKKNKTGAVLVVGGGIAGIQASLDLADSGFKVYLLEKGPSIGGIMAQLDKTFPTNDCAMCILAPKLVGTSRHPNIELITNAEIEEITGEAGNFVVAVRKKPRYVDEDKCTGCGVCMENCPVRNVIYPVEEEPVVLKKEDLRKVEAIIKEHRKTAGRLMTVLQHINREYNYLPPDLLRHVSKELDIPLSTVYHTATFYNAFHLEPRGKYVITVCLGTACHVKGAPRIVEVLQEELGIKAGETTKDMNFTLETGRCFGCCGLAPVMLVNENVHAKLKNVEIPKIIKHYKEEIKHA